MSYSALTLTALTEFPIVTPLNPWLPLFFLQPFFAFSRCTCASWENGKEIVSKSKGIYIWNCSFVCTSALSKHILSLTAWLMSFFQPCLLLFWFSFCETPLWIDSVIVEKSGYRSLAASNWKWKNLQNLAHEKEWESFLISQSNLVSKYMSY